MNFSTWLESIEGLRIEGPKPWEDGLVWTAILPGANARVLGTKDAGPMQGKVIGYTDKVGWIQIEPRVSDGKVWIVGYVGVNQDFHRQGIASLLHDRAWEYLKSQGKEFHSGDLSPLNLLYWRKLEQLGKAEELPKSEYGGPHFRRVG